MLCASIWGGGAHFELRYIRFAEHIECFLGCCQCWQRNFQACLAFRSNDICLCCLPGHSLRISMYLHPAPDPHNW